MATTGTNFNSISAAKSGQPFKKNVSCILGLTSASSTGNVSEVMTIANSCFKGGSIGGLPITGVNNGVAKALSTGTLAYNPTASQWIMCGNGVTSKISNVANTVLKSGAADFRRRSIPYKLTARTAFLSTLQWNANEIEGPSYTLTISASNPSFGNDIAAILTASARSSVFFNIGKATPVEVAYQTLTLW